MSRDFWKKHAGTLRMVSVCACALMIGVASLAAFMPQLFQPRVVQTQALTLLPQQTSAPQDPMEAFEQEREQLRSMQTAQLNEIIHDSSTDEATLKLARQQLLALCDWMEKESTVEGILRMRGYEGAICTVHADSVNVVIRAETVTKQESAVIYELVLRETGVTGGNVKIVPVS